MPIYSKTYIKHIRLRGDRNGDGKKKEEEPCTERI